METEEKKGVVVTSSQKKKRIKISKWHVCVAGIAALVLLAGASAYVAYKKGEEAGKKAARLEATMGINSALLNGSGTLPVQTVTGTVTEVRKDKIVVEARNRGKQTFSMNDQTRFTLGTDNVKADDIKNGMVVTIFASTQKSADEPTATRVIIRSKL